MQSQESAAICHLYRLFTSLEAAVKRAEIAISEAHGAVQDAKQDNTQDAYDAAISLLQRTLEIIPTLHMQHNFLSTNDRFTSLVSKAASYAIERGDGRKSVEILEQGRCMIWAHLRSFRTPLENLEKVNKPLSNRLRDISNNLETLTTSSVECNTNLTSLIDGSKPAVVKLMIQKRKLLEERERIVEEIRKEPGFEDFFKATKFEMLQAAAKEGPVIIINTSEYRSDAIIVLHHQQPIIISLDSDGAYRRAHHRSPF